MKSGHQVSPVEELWEEFDDDVGLDPVERYEGAER